MPLDRWLLLLSAAIAAGVPLFLLQDQSGRAVAPLVGTVAPPMPVQLAATDDADVDRRLFRPAAAVPALALVSASDEPEPAERPELIGIVGRLPDDAVALVRAEDGRSRTIRTGQSVAGWRLASLASDAALFVRGTERVRIGLDPIG